MTIMKTIEWPLLGPGDIEVKICTVRNGSVTLLLYQDSRCTMEAFDAKFGPFGWQMEYKDVGGQIYGSLSVKDTETGEWIAKEDTGDKSNISEDKGQSSDILKRCAVRWGFARELYSTPRIVIPDSGCRSFRVSHIEYDESRRCTGLGITDEYGREVFSWTKGQVRPYSQSQAPAQQETQTPMQSLQDFFSTAKKNPHIVKNELIAFKDYYKGRIEKGWSGTFDADRLWSKWMRRVTAS